MKSRMELRKAEPRIYQGMDEADKIVDSFDFDPCLRELVRVRVSQLNGCGYCVNYHTKDARKLGETEQRLYALAAWWETPFFTEGERAVLELTDEVTLIADEGVSDETFDAALAFLGEQKLAQLIYIISTTGSWNRLAISTHMVAEP